MTDHSTPPPPPPPAQPPAVSGDTNGLAVAALIVGILSLCAAFVPVVGVVVGLVAVVMAILGMNKAKKGLAGQRGLAVGGLITGAIGLILGLLVTLGVGAFFAKFGEEIVACTDPEMTQEQLEACLNEELGEELGG